jgi:YHS domain-containing protein
MMRREVPAMRYLWLGVLAVAALALLAGCGTKGEETAGPSAGPTKGPTATPERAMGTQVQAEATCAVCGTKIEDLAVVEPVVHEGHTYEFCSEACRAEFEKNPEKYTKGEVDDEPAGPPDSGGAGAPGGN